MTTIILSFIIMSVFILAMSVGVLMGRKPIQGSCGGLNKAGIEGECELCGNPANCKNPDQSVSSTVNPTVHKISRKNCLE